VKTIQLKIGQKLQFYVLFVTVIIFVVSIGYISLKDRERALRDAKMLIDSNAAGYAESISNSFNHDLAVVRTLAQAFHSHRNFSVEEWRPLVVDMHRQIFQNNPEFYALWDSWEFAYVDPDWDLPHGRFLNYHHRKSGQIGFDVLERSLDGDPPLYSAAKNAGREKIWEPYPDQLVVGAVGTTLMTTITVPMFMHNKYIGLVGVDITLEHLQNIISEINPFHDSYAFLVSHSGLYAAHPNTSFLEMPLADNLVRDEAQHAITTRIRNGERFSFSSSNEKGIPYYYTFAPVYIGETETPWSMGIAVPHNEIQREASLHFIISLFIALFGIGLIAVVVWLLARSISQPVRQITELMKRLARGEIDKSMNLNLNTGDELQQMAEAFNTSIKGLDEKTRFAESIGRGNLDTELQLLSEQDVLGKSLKEMQVDLKKASDEDKIRQEEDKIRSWSTEGYARFSEILRKNNDNLEALSFAIIKNLVKYLDANQGGIFILNNEDRHDIFLELKACYAFDRKKYLEKKILPGEGLVGTCFREGKTVYMTQIPQSYITITSGLGDENPSALVIVPLVLNEDNYGVIEIASFKEFTPYQIEFIEKIGESVASTISSVNNSIHTSMLLEKSQQQAEEMKAQEEEMRQNMEELHATQEEMARKNIETEGILQAIDSSSYVIEYDVNGKILSISDSFLRLLNLSRNDVVGTLHADRVEFSTDQQLGYENFWNDLKKGQVKTQEVKINVNGDTFWLAETYSPIFDQNRKVIKIFKIANNITGSKLEAERYQEEIRQLRQKLGENQL
jgi:methyl-accepting chemotaxis protein